MTSTPHRGVGESLSKRIWGFDWRSELPWDFDGIVAEAATFAEGLAFVERHYAGIFGPLCEGSRFLQDAMTPAKLRFGEEMDVVAFRDGADVVGLTLANPTDWSAYYFRSSAFLPGYQGKGLLSSFLQRSYEPLRQAGVERIDGECSPANLPMMKMLTRQGWVVTSTTNSERWGAVVRLSKFLREDAETVFLRQFCGMRNGRAARAVPEGPNHRMEP